MLEQCCYFAINGPAIPQKKAQSHSRCYASRMFMVRRWLSQTWPTDLMAEFPQNKR